MNKDDFKVEEDLRHLTEYKRYCWLTLAYGDTKLKSLEDKDADENNNNITSIWCIMAFGVICGLITMPKYPVFGVWCV